MVVWSHVALAGVWGGLLALERRAFLQAMLSRPLVASTGMGLLLDDLMSGLFVGLLLELFHLGSVALGAVIPDHDTLAATCTAAASAAMTHASGGHQDGPAVWALSVLLFVGMGRVGRQVDRALERYSARLASKAVLSAEAGDLTRAVRQNLWGMWPHFLAFGAMTGACAALSYALWPLLSRLPEGNWRALSWAYPAMAAVAAAVAAIGSRSRRAALYAGVAAALLSAVLLLARLSGGSSS